MKLKDHPQLSGLNKQSRGMVKATTTPKQGLFYRWECPNGDVYHSFDADNRSETDTKYKLVDCDDRPSPINIPPGMRSRVMKGRGTLVIVEGTRQHMHGAQAALQSTSVKTPDVAVVGMNGCWGWSRDGSLSQHVRDIPMRDRDVVICVDKDVEQNRSVWDAAKQLGESLKIEKGPRTVKYMRLSGGAKDGLDDVLRRSTEPDFVWGNLLDRASTRMPRRPAAVRAYVQGGDLMVDKILTDVRAIAPLAVTQDMTIAAYADGVYHNSESRRFEAVVSTLLGNHYQGRRETDLRQYAINILMGEGRKIPVRPDNRYINFRNGLLDPITLELHPHDLDHLSVIQFNTDWDPDATCPVFDKWIEDVLPGQRERLLDATCEMFDPHRTPSQAVFLYGPSRSGKSTYGRLLLKIVGKENSSAVSLRQLSESRFASANLYGSTLNAAMDLDDRDINDLSAFKQLTGEDLVGADRKYGAQFTFTNQALFLFSANKVPAVAERSKAWVSRVNPFEFPFTFIGNEDATYENQMIDTELPGLVVALISSLRERIARGGNPIPAPLEVVRDFVVKSNRAAEFIEHVTVPDGFTVRDDLYRTYKLWCEENQVKPLGKMRFYNAVRDFGVEESNKRVAGKMVRVFHVRTLDREHWGHEDAAKLGHDAESTRTHSETHVPLKYSRNKENTLYSHSQGGPISASPSNSASLPETAIFDLETMSVTELHKHNPNFIRLIGTETAAGTPVTFPSTFLPVITSHPGTLVAHNGFGFDFIAADLDVLTLSDEDRLIDTKVLAVLNDPPPAKLLAPRRYYGLDATAQRVAGIGKTDDIKALAKKHGGFDQIPVDDEDYNDYCKGDITATRAILDNLTVDDYARREMRVMARLTSSITTTGFRIDTDLLAERIESGNIERARRIAWLVDHADLPLKNAKGVTLKSPAATTAGKKALAEAFRKLGYTLPLTATGSPSLSAATLKEIIYNDGEGELAELAHSVQMLNGVRTVYDTVDKHMVNGRTHSQIDAFQASGRLSVTEPGLTVFGKRGGRHVEREIFLPDEGEVLVSFDLNQIDARAVAMLSQDRAYMDMFCDPSIDSHVEVSKIVFGTSDRRSEAKALAHAWNYGAGVRGIAKTAGVPVSVADSFDSKMRVRFSRLVEWQTEMRAQAEAGDLIPNTMGRYVRPDPERAWTQGVALPAQSLARDLMMEGVLNLPHWVVKQLRAVVHDEIVLSVPPAKLKKLKKAVLKAMQFEYLGVPVTADCEGTGASWGAIYEK